MSRKASKVSRIKGSLICSVRWNRRSERNRKWIPAHDGESVFIQILVLLLQFMPMKVWYFDDIEVCHECDLSWPTLPKRVLELLERTLVLKVVSVVVTGRLEYGSRSISCAHDNSARPLGRWYVLIIAGFTIITGKVCRWVSRGGTLWPQSSAERVKRSSFSVLCYSQLGTGWGCTNERTIQWWGGWVGGREKVTTQSV